jgi:hypothetical protein
MIWARMLAYITGTVDQELLLRVAFSGSESSNRPFVSRNRSPVGTQSAERGGCSR